jgi:multidrug efflux pump
MADLNLPVGTPIQRTEAVVKEIEQFMQQQLVVGHKRVGGEQERTEGITNWAAFTSDSPHHMYHYWRHRIFNIS